MVEPGLLPLGVAIAKLILRWRNLDDLAEATEDAKSLVSSVARLAQRTHTPDLLGNAISERLQERLQGAPMQHVDDINAAARDVADLMSRFLGSDQAVLAAAISPHSFTSWALTHGGGELRAFTARHAEAAFDLVLEAACSEFARLAPASPLFEPASLIKLLEQSALLPRIANDVAQIHDQLSGSIPALRDTSDYARRGAVAAEALLGRYSGNLSVAEASIQSTLAKRAIGTPFVDCEPSALGVHGTIAGDGETGLTPYVWRDHDTKLRSALVQLTQDGAQSRLLVAIGTSCSGKTRALYEAIRAVIPHWNVVAPKDANQLCLQLENGIPRNTIIWLDELQDRLTLVESGARAARYLMELLNAEEEEARPILVAATTWPDNLAELRQRPGPSAAAVGAGAVAAALEHAEIVQIRPAFTARELGVAKSSPDSRMRTAANTAIEIRSTESTWKLTQVLSGGPALIDRLYPPDNGHVDRAFSPVASAVLRAAADLRRVGLPNPLLRSTIEIAAPGYLGHLNSRPTASSLTRGLAEATFDATNDDVVTGARDHDNYRRGTPALAQAGTACFGGASIETYLLHDYLLEDHLARWQETATVPALWRAVLAHSQQVDDLPLAQVLSRSARRHGLLTTALALIEPWISSSSDARGSYIRLALFRGGLSESEIVELLSWGHSIEERRLIAQRVLQHGYPGGLHKLERLADAGDQSSAQALARLLAARGAATDLAALKRRSEDGDSAAQRQLLRVSAAGMAPEAMETLRTLASGGDESATERLYYLLAKRAGPNDIAELSRCALGGDIRARNRLNETLASEGSAEALAQVRSVATSGGAPDRRRLARVLARRGDESSIQELRERADAGDGSAQHHLARWLVSRGGHQELDELRRRGRGPDASARALYLDVLYRRRDIGGLKERVHAGDRQAASRLLSVYRHSNPAVRELDTEANPVTEVSGPALPASPRRMDS